MGKKFKTPGAAKYTGLSESYLEKGRFTEKGPPYYKCGKAVIYDSDDLDEWLQSRRVTSTSETVGA